MSRIIKTNRISVDVARETLGKSADKMTDLEILELVSLFQSLARSFLDNKEKEIFKGKTVKEVIF